MNALCRAGACCIPLFLTLLLAAPVRAQVCTAPTVAVLNQSDADTFACSEVTGNLFISDNGNGSLLDLSGSGSSPPSAATSPFRTMRCWHR